MDPRDRLNLEEMILLTDVSYVSEDTKKCDISASYLTSKLQSQKTLITTNISVRC